MTNSLNKPTLQEVQAARTAYRLAKNQRPRADIAPPTVLGIIDPADGTLSAVAVRADLRVQVPIWDHHADISGDQDFLYLDWAPGHTPVEDDFANVDEAVFDGGDNPDLFFPVMVTVPLASLSPDGPYTVRYRVETANGENSTSLGVPLICDSTPPWRHVRPCAMTLPFTQLTDAELALIPPTGAVATLADYKHAVDWQPGDTVEFYWLTHPLPIDLVDLPRPIASLPVAGPIGNEVIYPLSTLSLSQDTDYYAAYTLLDKARNSSPLSAYTRIDVAFGPLPSGLLDPVVPLAELDGLINLPDARTGVDVSIPRFDNYKPTDRIEVTWGRAVLTPEPIGSSPTFPLPIRVPPLALIGEYSFATGGEQATNVSYRVLRGEVGSAVQAITVDVDFSFIGPIPNPNPDPEWPDPVNGDLPVPEIRGRVSGLPNELNRTDAGEPADLTVELYGPLNEGEVIEFYWGSQASPAARYVVKDTDTAGDEITVEIPWIVIEEEGNRPSGLPVYYSIHAEDSENDQQCEPIDVVVDVVTIVPDPPIFLGLNPTSGWLTCVSLYADPANPAPGEPGIRVSIPDLTEYLADGDEVTLTWAALYGREEETPIPGAEKSEVITLGGATPATGFTWLVEPYATYILPTYDPNGPGGRNGRGRARYAFKLNGETFNSAVTEAVVSMWNAAGSCPIPP